VVSYFYPQDLDIASQAPELLDMLLTRSQKIILSNMRKASSLTLEILKSLYPKAYLGAISEGFTTMCTENEANDLVQGFLEIATQIVEMIPWTCERHNLFFLVHDIIVNDCVYL
jgi:hypothetical protein